jgi:hypothetical protein
VQVLDAIIMDEDLLAAVAARSYRHALGFDKVILLSASPDWQLRLHIWWPAVSRTREHAHNHRYQSYSAVVSGSLRTHVHQRSSSGTAYRQFRELSAPSERCWNFELVGDARLSTTMVADLSAGTTYAMSPDMVHHIEASVALSATLFLETRSVRDQSNVFVAPGDLPPKQSAQEAFTVSELRDRILRLRDEVDVSPI